MKRLAIAVTIALLLGDACRAKAGPVFAFQFDDVSNESDGIVTPPVVGTGTLTLPTDPGTGRLRQLPGAYKMSFTFGSTTFTQANIASDPTLTEVVLSADGSQRRAYFTDPGNGAGGPNGGSLNLTDSSGDYITFEPSFFGGHNIYIESGPTANSFYFGNYLGLAQPAVVPEPVGLTLAGVCLGGLALRAWRRRAAA